MSAPSEVVALKMRPLPPYTTEKKKNGCEKGGGV
jgi:hypothetical protein